MDKITQEEIDELRQRNAELESQLVEVNNNRTGISPCARFCEALAAKKMFDNLQTRNAELMAQIERLRDNLKSVLIRYDNGIGCIDTEGIELGNAFRFDDGEFNRLCRIVEMTPAQSLAEHNREVAARAIEDFADILINELSGTATVAYSGCGFVDSGDLSDIEVINTDCLKKLSIAYANKIKSGEVPL